LLNIAKMVKKEFQIAFKIICFIGCVYQSYKISEIYFRYDTTTYVKFENSGYLELPGITICYYKFIQLKDEFKHFNSDDINLRTIREQFDSIIKLKPFLIRDCIFKKGIKKSYDSNCRDFGDSNGPDNGGVTRLSSSSYCFTIFSQINGTSDEKYRINGTNSADWSMLLFFLKNDYKIPKLNIRLHDRKENIKHTYLKGYTFVNFKNARENLLIYSKTIVKYLFNPKDKPCFAPGHTRDDCIMECKIDEFIEKTGHFPHDFLNDNRSHNQFNFSTFHDETVFEWSDKCWKKCSQSTDCYKEFFRLDSRENEADENALRIEFPSHPTTIYEISLKMSVEEYLCYIASILSLWFGFSILSLTKFCLNFNNIYQRFIINKTQNKQKINLYHVNLNVKRPYRRHPPRHAF